LFRMTKGNNRTFENFNKMAKLVTLLSRRDIIWLIY